MIKARHLRFIMNRELSYYLLFYILLKYLDEMLFSHHSLERWQSLQASAVV